MRPILFMGGDKDVIRSVTVAVINKMMIEVEKIPTTLEKTLEISKSANNMKIDQTNVTINIDDNPFVSCDHPKPLSKDIQDQLRLDEEEKRQLVEEEKNIEEAKLKFLEEEKKNK